MSSTGRSGRPDTLGMAVAVGAVFHGVDAQSVKYNDESSVCTIKQG